MKSLSIALALFFSFASSTAVGRRNQPASPNMAGSTPVTAIASVTPQVANPAFVVTADQVRKAFDDAELRGEKQQGIKVGEEKSISIPAKDQMGTIENLKFSIVFLNPLEQGKADGYSFGLVAKQRTPADRKDFEDRSVGRITNHSNEVLFKVFLQQPKHDDESIPSITFNLVNSNGNRVIPLSQPTSYIAAGRDIIASVALAQEGQPVVFALFAGANPNLPSSMKKMVLVVAMDNQEANLEFALK
jgi:hypothetical protein